MTAQKLRRTERHEYEPGCGHQHCHIHDVDEDDRGAYIACGECGHVYLTARSLRQAYRRMLREITKQPRMEGGYVLSLPLRMHSWYRRGWSRLTLRASRIYWCPECAHDF